MDNVKKENKQDNLEFIKKLAEINNRNAVGGLLINIRKSRQLLEPIILQVKSKIQKIKQDKANAKVNGDNIAETNKIVEIKAEKAKESEIVVNEEPKQVKQEENKKVQNFVKNQNNNVYQNSRQNTKNNNQNKNPNSFAKKPFNPNQKYNNKNQQNPNAADKSLLGITRVKKNELSSASVFINKEKERNFGNKKKTVDRSEDKKLNKKQLIRRGIVEEQNIEERMVSRKLKLKKPKQENVSVVAAPITHAIITTPNLTVKILSEKIGKPVTEIIKQFMVLGIMTSINSTIDFATAELVASELGVELELKLDKTFEEKLRENIKKDTDDKLLKKRPPVVTVMGHVDHGKTSLLDYIRKSNIIAGEAGGITQHIGAYSIVTNGEKITFIDTPGHEAFTAMRARGAQLTDVAILVVAADDGIMPQTIEAINHIKAAKVPMIVAINKIDKPEANVERIKQQLTEYDVLPEEWGGDAIIVPISAKTGQGMDKLLEMILLVAEVQNLQANPNRQAYGVVLEAKLDKGRGPIANVIVQDGTLKVGDAVLTGFAYGHVRALLDENGKPVKSAGPSTPISILGLDNVPNAGDMFQVVDDKLSKNVIEERKSKLAQEMVERGSARSLDEFLKTPAGQDKKVLSIIIKGDVQGSVEALKQNLKSVENEEVVIDIVHSGVGNITEGDIQLAQVSNAYVIGFNIKQDSRIENFANKNKVKVKYYRVIYEVLDDVEAIAKGMKEPKYQEKVLGHAEVRMIFKLSSAGLIAGSRVLDGKILRNALCKIYRKEELVGDGKIVSLKNQKEDVKEMAFGFECGIKVDGFNDFQEGDIIECFVKEKVEE